MRAIGLPATPNSGQRSGYLVTDDVLANFDKAVDIMVRGIEEGVFSLKA